MEQFRELSTAILREYLCYPVALKIAIGKSSVNNMARRKLFYRVNRPRWYRRHRRRRRRPRRHDEIQSVAEAPRQLSVLYSLINFAAIFAAQPRSLSMTQFILQHSPFLHSMYVSMYYYIIFLLLHNASFTLCTVLILEFNEFWERTGT